jgi:hypothetical protein
MVGKARNGRFTLRGTGVTAGPGCRGLSPSAVQCPHHGVRIRLGAGDDRLALYGVGGDVDAGAGDDRVFLGAGWLSVKGGPGRDVLRGGRGRQGFDEGTTAEPDLIDGGPGRDRVSYAARRAPTRVDLHRRRSGEGDRLRGIEDVDGGGGADVLRGDAADNRLLSGAGARLTGGPGDDRLQLSSGTARCGPGDDMVDGPHSLLTGCEGVAFYVDDPSFVVELPHLLPSGRVAAGVRCFSEYVRRCRAHLAFTLAGGRTAMSVRGPIGRRLSGSVRVSAAVRRRLGTRHRLVVHADVRMIPYKRVGEAIDPFDVVVRRSAR